MIKVCLLAIACGLFGLSYLGDEPSPVDEYCDMVQLYKDSNGANGWPEYNQDIDCGGYGKQVTK